MRAKIYAFANKVASRKTFIFLCKSPLNIVSLLGAFRQTTVSNRTRQSSKTLATMRQDTNLYKKKMNYKYLLLLILLNTSPFFGQNLDQVLRSKKEIKEKISAIELISEKYDRSDLDSATFYKLVIDSLAALTNDYDLKSQAKRNLALIYVAQPDKAMKIAYQNLDLSTQSKDCKLITRAYILLARVNWFIRNDTKVFAFWNQALKEAEKCKDKEILMLVYSQGENHFFNTQQFEKSKQLSLKMAQLNPELLKESGYYAGIGDVFRALEKLDSADIYYKKAIKIEEDKKNFNQLVSLYSNYSLIPRAQKKYDVSIAYCKKALDLAVKFESEEWVNIVYRQL
jgi:tetratricopeptide (TPR) repeat protein